jgi:hypothetical protein
MTNKQMTKAQLLDLSDAQLRALTDAEFFAGNLELNIELNDNERRIAAEVDRRDLTAELTHYIVRRHWWDETRDPENIENARREIIAMLDTAIAKVQLDRRG